MAEGKPSAFFVVSFVCGQTFESRRGNMPSVPKIKKSDKL